MGTGGPDLGIGYSPDRDDVLAYYGIGGQASPILDELYEGVRDRALVVTNSKKALATRREHPVFPKTKEDVAQAILPFAQFRGRGAYPGLHCTHAAYIEPPKRYGEWGKWKAFHFFVDIDSARALEDSRRVAMAMCRELDAFDVPYMLKFSGLAGFHIHIDYGSFPSKIDGRDLIEVCPALYQRLKFHLIAKSVHASRWVSTPIHPSQYRKDTSGLQRVEYSLHEDSGLVACPIRSDQLEAFKMRDAMIGRVQVLAGWRKVGRSSGMDALVAELGSPRRQWFRVVFR